MKKITMLYILSAMAPLGSWAHPGHGGHDGDNGYTIIHYFTTLPHAFLMWGAVVGITLYFRHLYRREQKQAYITKHPEHARIVDRNGDY